MCFWAVAPAMAIRESWASRVGFIAAAVGSAVGLGNIWRFPYEAAANGGAAFLVVDLVLVLVIGLPAILVEFSMGRSAHRNVVDAYERGGRAWKLAGAFAMLTGFWILSYYAVVGGWVIRYTVSSAAGVAIENPEAYFQAAASGTDALLYAALFVALAVGVVALGVERGIELATKLMVPTILVLMVGLAVYASTLPGAGAGYRYFLQPDWAHLANNLDTIVPAALGEVLFTLSLGMGAMITYASYVGGDESLVADGFAIVVVNTFVAYLAGLVVFPLLFAQGVDPGEAGSGAIFVSVERAFATLPAGNLLGAVFYFVVFIAALSSAISLLEVVVSYFVDNYDVSRPVLAGSAGLGVFVLGVPSAYSSSTLTLFDSIASQLMLPVGIFLATVFVGWVYGREAMAEVAEGLNESFAHGWLWYVRVVVLLAVVVTLAVSVSNFTGVSSLVVLLVAGVVTALFVAARYAGVGSPT